MKKKFAWILAAVAVVICVVMAVVLSRNTAANENKSEKETSQQTILESTQQESQENEQIAQMIDILAETPEAQYYDPTDFLNKDSEEYIYLLEHSDETIKYIFNDFLENTDYYYKVVLDPRRENVMAVVMKDIIGGEALKESDIGHHYFEDFWRHNVKLLLLNGADFMRENYKYGYLIIAMSREKLDSYDNTYKCNEIDKRLRIFDVLFESEDDVSFADFICCITNSKYLKKSGEGVDIYKFQYDDELKFNVIISDNKLIGNTYYIYDKEFAYNNSGNFSSYTVSSMFGDRTDNSDDIKILESDKLKSSVISELKKPKYKEYVSSFDEDKFGSTLCYRYEPSDFMFVYNNTDMDYVYVFGANINDDDSEYNDCKVAVDAQTGNVIAVDFSNYFDNV